ncbi:MAG: SAM-dependent methyltransferase [Pseudanabaenaceae cyanobacterium bins.39]|nr:SAM-dependent methyltransferase [Pseudanabaenaceae cyanobacterium bins.39]
MRLEEVVPWGRTLAEYQSMFDLSNIEPSMQILGCGDGPASFNAELTQQGYNVVSVDPIYQFSADQIKQRVYQNYDLIISQVKANPDKYTWKSFRDADELGASRLRAMEIFLADYEIGKQENRYQKQELPHLEFMDRQFDLCLCSHLLFLYSEQLSLEFHLSAIQEMLRIAPRVQIFPVLQLDGQISPYLETAIAYFSTRNVAVEMQTVDYEVQKGGNQLLKLTQN